MQSERLEKVKSLLALALSRPPAEREAFLDSACAGDPALRREVDDFLGVGGKTDQFDHNAETVPHLHISNESPSAQVTMQIPADARIGRQFGKYLIRSRVAEGGMGIVYLALDTQLGREVALKVLPEYFSADAERLARFRREARATSLLNHPNIVTVFEIGQIEGCEYIVTEFVEGKTLRDLMREGRIPFVEVLKISSQVAGALAAAHRAGVVHRDIKPENVMIRPDGYVKVLDFGLAKLTDAVGRPGSGSFDRSGVNRTTPGVIMGTVSYMSPEQAEGHDTDARTDIWALGVIMYEMVAGRVPFSGPTASHTIVAILERDPEELENASPELKHLIATALQKDRALRFQTAEAMGSAIEELKHRLGYISDQNVSAAPVVTTERSIAVPVPAPMPRPGRKLYWLVPAAVFVLLAGALGVYAVASWLINAYGGDTTPPVNAMTPTPEPTVETPPVIVDPTPGPSQSPPVIYVEPTPEQKRPDPEPTVERPSRPVELKPTPRPARTSAPEPRRTPQKRPKPTQDPNCVFTNSCKS